MRDTRPILVHEATDFPTVTRTELHVLQVNLGYLCNLSCSHCHVNAGPSRTELMDRKTIDLILQALDVFSVKTLDLTGGAPEMNPHFRYLVKEARKRGVEVIDRCNLVILAEPEYEDLAQFLADNQVYIVASLPCYSEENVDSQRGKGVFESSIEGLQILNDLGFGKQDSGLKLDLVYNPTGAFLPPDQQQLQVDYKQQLGHEHQVEFNELLTLANMPISRFGAVLLSSGEFDSYMTLLRDNFKSENLDGLMCRSTLSIDWMGNCFDCDFNQMLELPLANRKQSIHLQDLLEHDFSGDSITIADHCFGCTAGQGSSCGGALS